MVINLPNERRTGACLERRQSMRTISFILAFAVVFAGPSMSGPTGSSLPGAGTFSYDGTPPISTPAATVLAGLTLAKRS
jgi:hypothetical protein